ncbi:MAG: MFS transporter [Moraxellaceae bacterium]
MNGSERRATAALGSIFALRMLGLFMIVPVFAVYGQQYHGATPALLGLAIGIYGLTQALLQIPMSLLADRFARKPLIVLGLLVFALGGAIAACADHIAWVILGRAVAGCGAVSAIVMALLADVTREEQRGKAMAAMGMTIALSFIVAFSLGPLLTSQIGLSGLFWLTSVAAILAIGLLWLVPTPQRLIKQIPVSYRQQLHTVLNIPDLNRLHFSIFVLHLLMTAVFVLLPMQLIQQLNLPINQHGWLYLPLLLLGFVLAIPAIIVAESKQQMQRIFMFGVLLIGLSMTLLMALDGHAWGLVLGLALFFIAFNLIEALLPSWLAKRAPVASRATAMGLNASSQFLGAFAGGVLGGQLLTFVSIQTAWAVLTGLCVIWWLSARRLSSPPYLSSLAVRLPSALSQPQPVLQTLSGSQEQLWMSRLLAVQGVEDVVILLEQKIAYLKIDKRQLGEAGRHELSQILEYPVAL